ncbi:hypothetical protein Cst_c00750 [Thermoclostridium stercorarium subsp. stercorarium DSM 8532]|uniref:Uncharacterized protein n=1 Tax=Thermoclostridium stercorarium (strain ATCC 35414 / DSM 8532 / NCIMB 11754) TaxID=1121335 RepID=L7VK65_THES1|nr:hypothetical protein Cst_c00750 [Thermoclostridium stercorarium subsp. stercorarium DSM 8532]
MLCAEYVKEKYSVLNSGIFIEIRTGLLNAIGVCSFEKIFRKYDLGESI